MTPALAGDTTVIFRLHIGKWLEAARQAAGAEKVQEEIVLRELHPHTLVHLPKSQLLIFVASELLCLVFLVEGEPCFCSLPEFLWLFGGVLCPLYSV